MNAAAPCVILNPLACGGRGLARWRRFLSLDGARGLAHAPVFDGSQGDGTQRLQQRLREWMDARIDEGRRDFIAAGGDGTVNAVVNALMGNPAAGDCRLGAVALGSSNDFHKGRPGINGHRLDFAAAFPHDIGVVRLEDGSVVHFAINASMGITAEANAYFNEKGGPLFRALKRRWTDGAIAAAALRGFARYRPFPILLESAGGERREARLVNLGVVKNCHFSGSFRYDAPTAADDGRLGVHLCDGMTKAETLRTLASLARGRFSGLPKTSSWQWPGLTVRADRPFALETDGEVRFTARADFSVREGGLRLCP